MKKRATRPTKRASSLALENCQCGWGRSQHREPGRARSGYMATNGEWQHGCRGFVPQRKWDIVFRHGVGAPDEEKARSAIKYIVTRYFGPKEGERIWSRIGFMFDIQERLSDGSNTKNEEAK